MNPEFRSSPPKIIIPSVVHRIVLTLILMVVVQACSRLPEITSEAVRKISPARYYYIEWSPDGSTILAQRMIHVDSDLYLVDVANGSVEKVTDSPDWYDFPKWSPDGSKIALTVGLNTIWIFDVAARRFSRLTEGEGAVWFPKGDKLAVYVGSNSIRGTDHREIRIIDLQGNVRRTLDVGPVSPELLQPYPYVVQPDEDLMGLDISPDGNYLIFSIRTYSGRRGDERGTYRMEGYVVDLTDEGVLPFLPGEPVGYVSWAPDGTKIAYIRPRRSGVGELVIADTEGKCQFIPDLPPEISSPSWAPDSSELAFLYGGAIHILKISPQKMLQNAGCP